MAGPSPQATQLATNAANQNLNAGFTSEGQSAQLNNAAFPGFASASQYYQQLASGDPSKVQSAVAPAVNQINQQYAQARQANATSTTRGGQQGDVAGALQNQKTAQIAGAAQSAVAGAPAAEGQLATQGLGLSENAIANAIAAFSGAGQTATNLGEAQAQGQAATIGAFGDILKAAIIAYSGA